VERLIYLGLPMYRDVWEWREKVKELPDEELIRIWAEEIDHNRVPVGLEGQLLLDELVRRKLFEQAEAASL
jgi:hypothetical protein